MKKQKYLQQQQKETCFGMKTQNHILKPQYSKIIPKYKRFPLLKVTESMIFWEN